MHVDMVDHNPLLHFYLAPSVSLLDAIEVQQDSRVTFCGRVKEVSEILTYKNRDGAEKRYRRVVVGRVSALVAVRSYQVRDTNLKIDASYMFSSVSILIN